MSLKSKVNLTLAIPGVVRIKSTKENRVNYESELKEQLRARVDWQSLINTGINADKEIAELKANSIPKSLVMDMISKWMYEKNKTEQYQDSKHHIYAAGALSALNSLVNQGAD